MKWLLVDLEKGNIVKYIRSTFKTKLANENINFFSTANF